MNHNSLCPYSLDHTFERSLDHSFLNPKNLPDHKLILFSVGLSNKWLEKVPTS